MAPFGCSEAVVMPFLRVKKGKPFMHTGVKIKCAGMAC